MSLGGGKSQSQQQSTSNSELNPQALSAILGNIGTAQNLASTSTYHPLTTGQIQTYQSPYTQDVANTTLAELNNQNQQQDSQNGVTAAASGDYNSNRFGIQNALTNQLYGQTAATTLAGLNQAGYTQAENTAANENTAQNNFPLALQTLLNQAVSSAGSAQQSTAQSTGSSSSFNVSGGIKLPGTGG